MPQLIYMAIGKQFSLIMVLMLVAASFMLIWVPQVSAVTPTTTLTVSGPEYVTSLTYVNDFTTFTLSADPSSGSSIWYKWNDNAYQEYTGPFTAELKVITTPPSFPVELMGLNTLYYNGSDDSGNHEIPKSLEIFVDSTSPESSLFFTDDIFEDTVNYITIDTSITLSAIDSDSGVDKIYYSIDDGVDTEYTGLFYVPGSGSKTINYYSVDNVGNQEAEKSIPVFIDNANPTLIVNIGQPTEIIDGLTYANEDSGITISTLDDSGISLIRYNLDGGSWITYTNSFYLTQNGAHVLNIESIDNLGHSSTETLTLYLDNSPPVITASLSDNSVVEYGTLLYLNAADGDIPGSECTILYTIDDGATWLVYVSPIFFQESGNISYYAKNILGDASTVETIKITVNPESNDLMNNLNIWLVIVVVGIILLILINKDKFVGKKDSKPEKTNEDNEKKDKKK